MGSTYGRQVLDTVGSSVQVAADGRPQMKLGGVTVDWATVVATTVDVNLEDGFFCPAGEKYLRFGQVLTRENPANTQTVTMSGSPTGGTFTLTVVNPNSGLTATTAPIAWNATGTDIAVALMALGNVGTGNVLGSGPQQGPWGISFVGPFLGVTVAPMTSGNNLLTGGSGPTVTVAAGPNVYPSYGLWGPYDPNAVDGRAVLTRPDTFILNESVREIDFHSNHVPVLWGGYVWRDRILANTVAASLVAGPLWSALDAVMINLQYAKF